MKNFSILAKYMEHFHNRVVNSRKNYRNSKLLGGPINDTVRALFWRQNVLIMTNRLLVVMIHDYIQGVAVWSTDIVCRSIFQIRFEYWSWFLNLVSHATDWDVILDPSTSGSNWVPTSFKFTFYLCKTSYHFIEFPMSWMNGTESTDMSFSKANPHSQNMELMQLST